MKWHWVYDTDYRNEASWKSHAIPDVLFTPIMESLHERGFLYYDQKVIEGEFGFDLPGMAWAHRKELTIDVDGLQIVMPCTDWEYIHAKLSRKEVRVDAAVPYYKLHGFLGCICLTPEQRDSMLSQMAARMDEANAFREIENHQFNAAMSRAKGMAVADGPQDAEAAIKRAKAEGKNPHVLVARRPTKDDSGKA